MTEVWRARDVPPAARVEYMRGAIADTIVPFDLHMPHERIGGEIRAVDVGMVRVVSWSGAFTEGEVVRTPRLIRRSDPELCKIDMQFLGRAVFEQDDRQAGLGPGEFAFADLSRPCRLAGSLLGGAAVLFPRALLPFPCDRTKELSGSAFRADVPGTGLVAALVRELAGRPEAYGGVAGARIGAAVVDLIVATVAARLGHEAMVPLETRRRALTLRINAFIEERLGDPELSPAMIAAAHHISLRLLYNLFEAEGRTVAGWMRGRRLERCRRDLADPALADRPVGAIARRWGFTDPGHFSRAFRAAYGIPPVEYRRWCT